mgnify:CR=1 FL=1|tara:strand:- start:24 stop:719 length:696 start_codon:yes stop_codon:yes gene_type:complete
MKKINIIKKVLPIIFLSLLLLLLPLFKSNYSNEYFKCNYNLNTVTVTEPYNCEGDFLNKYKIVSDDNNEVITADRGSATECIAVIASLLDKLDKFFIVKSKISDISTCELSVADERIENLANIIKLKMLLLDSCEITYEEYDLLDGKLINLGKQKHVDDSVIKNIRRYYLRNAVKVDEQIKAQSRSDRAETCLNYKRENAISDCSIKGNKILGIESYIIDYTGVDVDSIVP